MPLGMKGFQPGRAKTGGRQRGTLNHRNTVRRELLESLVKLPEQLDSMTPLEAMLLCMRWSLKEEDRAGVLSAAAAAAPYCHARLTSTDVRVSSMSRFEKMSD